MSLLKRQLTRWLGGMTLPGEAPAAEPDLPAELTAGEAHLKVLRQDGHLQVDTTFRGTLFRIPAEATGRFQTVRTQRAGRPAVVLQLPIRVEDDDSDLHITFVQFGASGPTGAHELVRATRRRVPPTGQALEFTFAAGADQVRYLVELTGAVQPEEFREFSRTEAVFKEVPPVSQMVAFLKATLHQRRTALRSLQGLSRRCQDERVRRVVDGMARQLSQSQDFPDPQATALHRLLEEHGSPVYASTATALCLLADIHRGQVDEQAVEDLILRERPLDISERAARAVAAFLDISLEEEEAQRRLGAHGPEWREDLEFLRTSVAERTALTILEDLAEDSGSAQSRARVERLLQRVSPQQDLGNDEQEALRSYLAACGRPVHKDSVAALCLYVDFEAGIFTEEDIDSLAPARGFVDNSLYALLSVAGAYEADLRCFILGDEDRWRSLRYLTLLGHKGLIARFLEEGEPGYHTRHLPDPAAVDAAREQGLSFTGEVLVQLPVLEHLDVADLATFTAKGIPVMACFQSEDRHVMWRRAEPKGSDPRVEPLAGPYGFIDGFRAYRFHHRVVGRCVPAPAERLVGRDHVVAVYLDQRGNRHYHHLARVDSAEQVAEPPRYGLEWAEQAAVFPDPEGFPQTLVEPSHEFLLGRPEDSSDVEERLRRAYRGLTTYLTRPDGFVPLGDNPAALDRARRSLRSAAVRSLLVGVVDAATRNALVGLLGKEGQPLRVDLQVLEPLLLALDLPEAEEFAVLALLQALCSSDRVRLAGRRKYLRRERFVELLQDRLFRLADSANPAVRAVAFGMMGALPLAATEQRRQACAYVLSRHLDDVAVGGEAAVALSALALARAVPPPVPLQVPAEVTAQVAGGAAEAEELVADIRGWLGSPPGGVEETPSRANLKGEERKVVSLAGLLARANETFRQDGSLGSERLLGLVPAGEDRALRKALFDAWHAWSVSRGIELGDLKGPEAREDFQAFLGPQAVPPLEVFVLAPGEALAVRRDGGAVHPLFLRLAALAPATDGEDEPCLLLLPPDLALEGDGPVRTAPRPPDLGECQVFRGGATRWVPFLHPSLASSIGLGWAERASFEGLARYYETLAARPPEEPMADEEGEVWTADGQASLRTLADDLARYFNIPGERRQSALHMLVGLSPLSLRPLPPE